jgi:hypothetical protein
MLLELRRYRAEGTFIMFKINLYTVDYRWIWYLMQLVNNFHTKTQINVGRC